MARNNIFSKNTLPYWLFVAVWLVAYLPYFIYCPLPDIQADTFSYFYVSHLLTSGHLPLPELKIDLPVGFPMFIGFCKMFSPNVGLIVLLQNIIYVLASLFLIRSFHKKSLKWAWCAAVALIIFSVDSYTMRFNTALYTEALYTSSLIIVAGLLTSAFFKPTNRNLFLLGVSLLIPSLIRSNGIYLYFLIPVFLFLAWQNKWGKKSAYSLLAGLLVGWFAWASLNYVTKGIFFIGDYARIKNVMGHTYEESKDGKINEYEHLEGYDLNDSYGKKKWKLFSEYIWSGAVDKPSFYYTCIKDRYRYLYIDSVPQSDQVKIFAVYPVDSLAPGLRQYIFDGYRTNRFENAGHISNINYSPRNNWLYFMHIVYKAYSVFIRNAFWVVLYLLVSLAVFVGFFRKSNRGGVLQLIAILSAVHILSVLLITIVHPRAQDRYVHVSEFIMYIVIGLFILEQVNIYFSKKQITQDAVK